MFTQIENRTVAPSLLEDIFTFEDAFMVRSGLNTLKKKFGSGKICMSRSTCQYNAPIMTGKGGKARKQTTYYPPYYTSVYGRGQALFAQVK